MLRLGRERAEPPRGAVRSGQGKLDPQLWFSQVRSQKKEQTWPG